MHDPEWDEDDRDAVFAYDQAQATSCSGCGLPLEETTDVDREDLYSADLVACHACAAADRAMNALRGAEGDMAGIRVRFVERPPYEPPGAPGE